MLTISLAIVGLGILFVVALLLVGRFTEFDLAVIWVSWIPAAALLIQWLFRHAILEAMSYASVFLPIATAILGFLIGLVGLVLLLTGHYPEHRSRPLQIAVCLAFTPVFASVVFLVLALARSA